MYIHADVFMRRHYGLSAVYIWYSYLLDDTCTEEKRMINPSTKKKSENIHSENICRLLYIWPSKLLAKQDKCTHTLTLMETQHTPKSHVRKWHNMIFHRTSPSPSPASVVSLKPIQFFHTYHPRIYIYIYLKSSDTQGNTQARPAEWLGYIHVYI